jgi:hypothetical protein
VNVVLFTITFPYVCIQISYNFPIYHTQKFIDCLLQFLTGIVLCTTNIQNRTTCIGSISPLCGQLDPEVGTLNITS